MFSEGYVGVTSRTAEERYYEHLSCAKAGSNLTLYKAIRKYGDKLIVQTVLEADIDYCLLMESKIRSENHVGWNIVKGGGKPPVFRGHSEESKKKIGEGVKNKGQTQARVAANVARKGVKRSVEDRAKMSAATKGRPAWKTSTTHKDTWAAACEIFEMYQKSEASPETIAGTLDFPISTVKTMFAKFDKQNWNPLEDQTWLEWVQNYKLNKGSR